MINANLIRARIVEQGMNQQTLAEKIGMTQKTLSIKLKTGKFGLDEADKIIEVLQIEDPERYFFHQKVN